MRDLLGKYQTLALEFGAEHRPGNRSFGGGKPLAGPLPPKSRYLYYEKPCFNVQSTRRLSSRTAFYLSASKSHPIRLHETASRNFWVLLLSYRLVSQYRGRCSGGNRVKESAGGTRMVGFLKYAEARV